MQSIIPKVIIDPIREIQSKMACVKNVRFGVYAHQKSDFQQIGSPYGMAAQLRRKAKSKLREYE
jgi:hypothetical protein